MHQIWIRRRIRVQGDEDNNRKDREGAGEEGDEAITESTQSFHSGGPHLIKLCPSR